jgi:4-amino-4-deoxy-L-arabinose transferase-like glycosyltransferase
VFIGVFTLTFIGIASSDSLLLWDEAVYIGIAKHISSAGSYGLFESFRPFALPIMLVPFLLIGAEAVVSAKVLAAFFAGALLLVTFLLARNLTDDRIGLLAVLILATTAIFVQESHRFMTEIPSAILIVLSVFALVSNRPSLSGVIALIAFAIRYPSGLIVPALILIAFIRGGWKRSAMVIGGFVAGLVPLLLVYSLTLPQGVRVLTDAALHQSNAFFGQQGFFGFLFYPIALLTMQPLFSAALIPQQKNLRILIIPIMLALTYFTLIVNKQERFIIFIIPFLAILAAGALARIKRTWMIVGLILIVGVVISGPILISYAHHVKTPLQSFLQDLPLDEPTATSDPGIAAYHDVRVVPIYFSYDDIEIRAEGYKSILFLRQGYGCSVYGSLCEAYIDRAYDQFTRSHRVEQLFEYEGLEYTLFVRGD